MLINVLDVGPERRVRSEKRVLANLVESAIATMWVAATDVAARAGPTDVLGRR